MQNDRLLILHTHTHTHTTILNSKKKKNLDIRKMIKGRRETESLLEKLL